MFDPRSRRAEDLESVARAARGQETETSEANRRARMHGRAAQREDCASGEDCGCGVRTRFVSALAELARSGRTKRTGCYQCAALDGRDLC